MQKYTSNQCAVGIFVSEALQEQSKLATLALWPGFLGEGQGKVKKNCGSGVNGRTRWERLLTGAICTPVSLQDTIINIILA